MKCGGRGADVTLAWTIPPASQPVGPERAIATNSVRTGRSIERLSTRALELEKNAGARKRSPST